MLDDGRSYLCCHGDREALHHQHENEEVEQESDAEAEPAKAKEAGEGSHHSQYIKVWERGLTKKAQRDHHWEKGTQTYRHTHLALIPRMAQKNHPTAPIRKLGGADCMGGEGCQE